MSSSLSRHRWCPNTMLIDDDDDNNDYDDDDNEWSRLWLVDYSLIENYGE